LSHRGIVVYFAIVGGRENGLSQIPPIGLKFHGSVEAILDWIDSIILQALDCREIQIADPQSLSLLSPDRGSFRRIREQ
jgi:hypothetical protein